MDFLVRVVHTFLYAWKNLVNSFFREFFRACNVSLLKIQSVIDLVTAVYVPRLSIQSPLPPFLIEVQNVIDEAFI